MNNNPNAATFTWTDGTVWTVIIDQSVYIYEADATELGLNSPVFGEWMVKPDWVP